MPPRWDFVAAIHDGRPELHTVHATLMRPDGIKRLEEQHTSETEQGRRDTLVAPLIDEWPAMPLGKQTRPEEQTRIERRNRMRRIALTLPTLRHWTPDALQGVLSPDADTLETRELKGVGNWETQRTYRNALKMFYAWLVVQGYITVNPAQELRVDKREQRAIRCVSFDVLKRIHQQLPPGPACDAFGLMMATGVEPQVVARVTAEDLRPKEQKVVLSGTKNQYRKRVAFVESWYGPRLVELAKGKRSTDALIPMTRFDIADAVREAVRALHNADPDIDIPEDFRPYYVRHWYAARYVAAGALTMLDLSQPLVVPELDGASLALTISDLCKHVLVTGGSGAGKSQSVVMPLLRAALNLRHAQRAESPAVLIIDPKRELSEVLSQYAPDAVSLASPDVRAVDLFGGANREELDAGTVVDRWLAVAGGDWSTSREPFWRIGGRALFVDLVGLDLALGKKGVDAADGQLRRGAFWRAIAHDLQSKALATPTEARALLRIRAPVTRYLTLLRLLPRTPGENEPATGSRVTEVVLRHIATLLLASVRQT